MTHLVIEMAQVVCDEIGADLAGVWLPTDKDFIMIIRTTTPYDHRASEELVRDVFWDLYRPGCLEHLVLHLARESGDLVSDLLAADGDEIVGSIISTRARVDGDIEVLYLGPLAVATHRQRQGIGEALLTETLTYGASLGFPAAVLYGDPGYYGRFGFVPASRYGITTADGSSFDAFMALELHPGALDGVSGRLTESAAFGIEDADAFDADFPPRVKHIRPGQFA